MIRFLKTITFVRVFHGFFISLILATSLSYAGTPIFSDGHENQRQQLSVPVPGGYQKTEGRDATELTKGVAASAAAGATETWLNQFGTARVNLRVDSRFSLQNSSFDFLLPLYDTPDDVVFTQLGAREHDDLFTTNVGLGHRHFFNQWMMGYNVFWDNSWRNVNRRYGLGLEIWRNNNIVLDYRKQNRLQLSFPPQITGEEQSTVTFRPVVKASNGLDYIELNDTALIQAGGRVISVSNSAITIQLPEYQSQPVRLSGVAVDSKGNRSDVAETLIMTSQRMTSATITTDKTTAIANGTDAVTYTVTVKDDHNRPVADEVVTWTTNMGILGTPSAKMTDNNGQVTVTLTSTTAGNAIVSADAAGRHLTAPAVLFSDAASVSSLKLVVSSNNAEADSRSQNIVNVTVLDKSNKPLKGVQVDWVIAGHTSAAAVTPTKVMTDDNGNATLALTDSTAEIVQVSVSAGNLSAQTSVTFIVPKVASLSLSPADDWSQSPDEPLTVTATVLDKYGQPVKGVNVIWSLSNTQDFRALSPLQSVSDENGHAVFEVVGSIMSSNTVITVVAGEKTAELYLVIGIG
ncbi:Ig-like domain-containing protein [Morganella morganii]|uniref:Ig-like domain-containing protein n=1 Tax=Morganella morganii TaxID=582 RepID=UPI000D1E70C5|nr:Ig-like domain-containing protein [Morganella morganii]QXO50076.1 Ig-like domain-containing protein [Morganella morganii]